MSEITPPTSYSQELVPSWAVETARVKTVALPTMTVAPLIKPDVFRGVLMSLRAARQQNAARAATDVFGPCHQLQMSRPDAIMNTAKVIPFETLRGLSDQKMVSKHRDTSRCLELSIPVCIQASSPKPAVAKLRSEVRDRAVFIDLDPETLVTSKGRRKPHLTAQLVVMVMAETARKVGLFTTRNGANGKLGSHLKLILSGVIGAGSYELPRPSIVPGNGVQLV